ncbi:hypothetical protein [Salinispora vitiensis]|uniref:hypothetical protein n=1 Tax=Salinispora vitiensis TaxID=999544 RepID=UPI00037F03F5|nr:hypothetical protein [Salinispora vitiensis]
MAFVHGKDTYLSLDGNDLSPFTKTSSIEQESDEHDVTTYGRDDYVFTGGLRKGSFSMGGVYDNTDSGPKAVIEPLIGAVVTLIRRAEGTDVGLPEESVDVLVKKYTETNPVADMITWSCELTISGTITRTVQ